MAILSVQFKGSTQKVFLAAHFNEMFTRHEKVNGAVFHCYFKGASSRQQYTPTQRLCTPLDTHSDWCKHGQFAGALSLSAWSDAFLLKRSVCFPYLAKERAHLALNGNGRWHRDWFIARYLKDKPMINEEAKGNIFPLVKVAKVDLDAPWTCFRLLR